MTRPRVMSLVAVALVVASTVGLSVVAAERQARHHAPPSRVPIFVDAYQPDLPAASEIDTPGPVEPPAVTR
ncbi:MAG: hypothetical protein HY216_04725 [Candidatus Rokubacteria bacterium]|nr:hypothetical protein [Candidatus Rokubacteria bacterium]